MDKVFKYLKENYPKDILGTVPLENNNAQKFSFGDAVFYDSTLYQVGLDEQSSYQLSTEVVMWNRLTDSINTVSETIDLSSYQYAYEDSNGDLYEKELLNSYQVNSFTDSTKIKKYIKIFMNYYSSADGSKQDTFWLLLEFDLNGNYLNQTEVSGFVGKTVSDGVSDYDIFDKDSGIIRKKSESGWNEFINIDSNPNVSLYNPDDSSKYYVYDLLIKDDYIYLFTIGEHPYELEETHKFDLSTGDYIESFNYGFVNMDKTMSKSILNAGVTPIKGFKDLYAFVKYDTNFYYDNPYYDDYYDYSILNESTTNEKMFLVGVTTAPIIYFTEENITTDGTAIEDSSFYASFKYIFDSNYFLTESTERYSNIFGNTIENGLTVPPDYSIISGKMKSGKRGYIPEMKDIEFNSDAYYVEDLISINYEIYTPNDLFNMRYDNRGQFKLMNNIDLVNFTVPDYHLDDGWIFTQEYESNSFPSIVNYYGYTELNDTEVSLNLDGQGFEINNFKSINTTANNSINGLIGRIYDESYPDDGFPTGNDWTGVKNLKMNNVNVRGNSNVGAVVGYMDMNNNKQYIIKNVQVEGYVAGNDEAGGISGYAGYFSYNNADEYYPETVTIEKCSFKGTIDNGTSGYGAGGILGWGSAKIKDCFVIADVACPESPGGICGGWEKAKTEDVVKNCYFVGTISGGSGSPIAVDWALPEGSVINCYYDSDVFEGTTSAVHSTPKTTEEMIYPLETYVLDDTITFDDGFEGGEFNNVTAGNNGLELKKTTPDFSAICDFIVSSPSYNWISKVKIVNQNGTVLLDTNTPEYSSTGYRDMTDMIIETSVGDVLTISVTVDIDGTWTEFLSWGNTIADGTLQKVADLKSASAPFTHTFDWTVPDNPGGYLMSFWTNYSRYTDPCGNKSYAERQDFTLAIDTTYKYVESGYRITDPIDTSKVIEFLSSNSSWTENLNGQTLNIYSSVNNGSSWDMLTNNDSIPGLVEGVESIRFKQELITNNTSYSPVLNSFNMETNVKKELRYVYEDWDFEEVWGIHANENDGYPNFNTIVGMLINYSANSGMDFGEFMQNYYLTLNYESIFEANVEELEKKFPIVRTDFAKRDGYKLLVAGTLLDPAQYNDELWDGKISGFFQWVPERFEFDDFSLNKTGLTKLPYKKYSIISANVVEDIQIEDTEIVVENIPTDFQIASENGYGYLVITDGTNSEAIGYGLTETRDVDGVTKNIIGDIDRGVFTSNVKSFNAVDTVVYKTYLETSLTWEDEISPVARRTKYKYRAGIEVDTELSTTGDQRTFTFYGGTMIADVDDSDSDSDLGDFSGMDRSELFLDARDLEFEDQLFDRAKLKFEEMEFESWNLEEFKDWTWDEFQNPESLEFERMTLAELIKIADGITDYEERDLVNNYSREEIEQIIQDKLNIVTVDDIESWAFDVSKLVARLLTGEPSGAYDSWTEREVKDFLITMLTNEFSFGDFEDKFPFEKWEKVMKARLEININNNASIEVEYNQYGPYNYMIDFQLGDIIVVEYPDVFRAMIRIIEVKEEYTPQGKKYTLTLGKEFENIISKIKADNDDVSRRL